MVSTLASHQEAPGSRSRWGRAFLCQSACSFCGPLHQNMHCLYPWQKALAKIWSPLCVVLSNIDSSSLFSCSCLCSSFFLSFLSYQKNTFSDVLFAISILVLRQWLSLMYMIDFSDDTIVFYSSKDPEEIAKVSNQESIKTRVFCDCHESCFLWYSARGWWPVFMCHPW